MHVNSVSWNTISVVRVIEPRESLSETYTSTTVWQLESIFPKLSRATQCVSKQFRPVTIGARL